MKIKIDPLDRLFSKYIRLRAKGFCERCGQYKGFDGLQTSHFHGRGQKSVRYDPDNACALDFGCHQYFTSHPLEHTEFFKNRLGDKFDMLNSRARTPARYLDKEAIRLYLGEQIKELEDNIY